MSERTTRNGMTFKEWMRQVDRELIRKSGLSSRDLADQTYWDWFFDGISPEEAAEETLENEGFPG
ncbi:MAG: hypothetical protein D6816_16270 [Bacteroidetes bacterium]|nr:MAG: hypothetical protein D6816_16270 [Bacteroidota bacterium]